MKKLAFALCMFAVLTGCSGYKKGMSSGMDGAALAAEFEKQVGDRVYFEYDSSAITAASKMRLTKQAEWIRAHNGISVVVEGHCDERGTREYNLALGERRAAAVKNFLAAQGVDANSVDTISYGKERPAVVGAGEAVWKMNRRGVTVISSK